MPAAGCSSPPPQHCRGFIPCLGAASLPAGRHGGISGHKAKHCKKKQESHQPCARSGTEAALQPSPALCRHRKPQRAEPLGGCCPGTPVAATLCPPSPARWAALGTGQAPCSLSQAQHRVPGRALQEPDPFSRASSHPGIPGRRLQAFLSTGKQGTLLSPQPLKHFTQTHRDNAARGRHRIKNLSSCSLAMPAPGCWALLRGAERGSSQGHVPTAQPLLLQGPAGPRLPLTVRGVPRALWWHGAGTQPGGTCCSPGTPSPAPEVRSRCHFGKVPSASAAIVTETRGQEQNAAWELFLLPESQQTTLN